MSDLWYRTLCSVLVRTYYHRLRVVRGAQHSLSLPTLGGPVLYVALHRNGAVDGLIYKHVLPRATFLISAQLVRSRFGRLFFVGIPVTRAKDAGDRGGNSAALDQCVAHLAAGGQLCVLPEGTSDLGPRHLPFKPGTAQILERALAIGAAVTVVPLGIFYETPEAFRSDVTVVVGNPVPTDLPVGIPTHERTAHLTDRVTAALENVGVNVDTAAELTRIETMAALTADGPGLAYYTALKALESHPPPHDVAVSWQAVADAVASGRLAADRGIPVLSRRGLMWNLGWLCVQGPLVGLAALANLPVIAGAALASRRLADARNTVALWRLLSGAPLAVLWLAVVGAAAIALGRAWIIVGYLLISLAGLRLYPELRARWPRLLNARRVAQAAPDIALVTAWVRERCAADPPARRG